MTTTPPVHLLPPLDPTPRTLEPVDVLLAALDHIARTRCTAARDAQERRELLYHDASAHFASTRPEAEQQDVYNLFAAKLPKSGTAPEAATADELRVATLSVYGWAVDCAVNGGRNQGHRTWTAAAIAALELYRNRALKHLSGRSNAAVTA